MGAGHSVKFMSETRESSQRHKNMTGWSKLTNTNAFQVWAKNLSFFFFHSLFYLIFFLILLLLPETLRWRMGKQRFPLMWKSREMYWWWSIMQDLRWGDVCRPRYIHTSFGATHMNQSVSHKKTWYKWRKGDFFNHVFVMFQMASMKMFQVQFHTGFVPRNATNVKFAKYVHTFKKCSTFDQTRLLTIKASNSSSHHFFLPN